MTPRTALPTVDGEVVLALAGHVDHGKSALAGVLTGQPTDRRRAERSRGLTIDLGHLVLGDGATAVAMTDVPGHVDYLGNTLVGLAGATGALLVVAADDGWMPQTEDHVRAARCLDVPVVMAVVSKSDLVPAERARQVCDDVRRRLADDPDVPPVVVASAVTGHGVDEVRTHLGRLPRPSPHGTSPRLWIDRDFHVGGRGLVVAGTLTHGALAVGDRVAVAPVGAVGRVRGLQRHGTGIEAVRAPARVAIDLVDAAAQRGDRLVAAGLAPAVPATAGVDAWLWSQHPAGIGERGAWLVHVGSTQVEARILPVQRDAIEQGQDGAVHLQLSRPVALVHGDRFVLRDTGRRVVAGGGVVLDPAPPDRARGAVARDDRAAALAALHASRSPRAALVAADGGACEAARVATAFADPDVSGTGAGVEVRMLASHLVTRNWFGHQAAELRAAVEAGGPQGRPLEQVAAQASATAGVPVAVVRAALADLEGVDRHDTHLVASSHRAARDDTRAAALAALHDQLRAAPLAPAPLSELAAGTGVTSAELDRLVQQGRILVSGDYGFLPPAVQVVVQRLRRLQDASGPFSVAQARDVLGITRRHAVPWMELLDRLGATTREGDRRRLTPSAGSPPPSRPGTDR